MMCNNIFRSSLLWLFIVGISLLEISACSSGAAEKPEPKSITSPAQLLDQGIQKYNDNDYQHAITYFEKSLLQYRSIDSATGIAQSSLNMAKTLMAINNDQLAAEYIQKAGTIIQQENLNNLTEHLHLTFAAALRDSFYNNRDNKSFYYRLYKPVFAILKIH